nr:DNA polymerase phi-like protein [uncultured Mediterranean phage uvMED]
MSDLLKEAIADAKAVRETALANAKMALEEAFTPHLKSMLSAKLAEDDIEEDENPFADEDEADEEESADEGMHDSPRREDDDEEMPVDGDEEEEEVDESEIVEIDGVKYAPIVSEEEHEDEEEEGDDDEADMDESEDLDLEAVIKELEEELEESKEDEEDSVNEEEITEGDVEEEKVDEEIDLNEEDEEDLEEQSTSSGIGKGTGVKQPSASDEEDPGKGKVHESVEAIQSELNEYKEAVVFLKDKLHEVNILNAKLLYTNKLFKEYALSNDQKLKIVETFDRAQTTREIKLVYSTLAESFTGEKNVKKEVVKEFASKKSGGTAPSKKIISEENQVADRFRKLAGIL